SLTTPCRPRRPLFPYTTLFRSPHAAEDPEVVLAKPLLGFAHRAHRAALEVGAAAERIAPLVAQRVVRDGVDGEVPAGQILVERRSEEHTSELQSRGHLVCRLRL